MYQAERQTQEKDSVSADQVHAYLADHPGFFADNTELLESLVIPHATGQAVSLVAKQLEFFRTKNEKLVQQLNILVQIARDNDELFRKMHRITIALMEANDVESALAGLQSVLHEHFQADFVSLRILRKSDNPPLIDVFISPDDERLEPFKKLLDYGRPKCGSPNLEQAAFLFGDNASKTQSCAIIPVASSTLNGLLGIGSIDEEKFLPTMGHMFLIQLGELVGLRLDTLLQCAD